MEQRGVTPPFMPPTEWYVQWWRARLDGKDDPESIAEANGMMERVDKKYTRNFSRCKICMADGREQMLSVPLDGGAKALRGGKDVGENTISDHGNWRHVHLGAINAAYGKTPFFPHLLPEIEEAYRHSYGKLEEFNIAIHRALSSFIINGSEPDALRRVSEGNISRAVSIGLEMAEKTEKDRSILDLIMKFGPETLLYLYYAITA